MEFEAFEKIPRWSREVCITEKLDGTNAQISILERCMVENDEVWEQELNKEGAIIVETEKYKRLLRPGSRNRYLTQKQDNYQFWEWCYNNRDTLAWLGLGRHFGEWWGLGIQRRYGLSDRRFSLFNATRWTDDKRPACCGVVPILYKGPLEYSTVENCMEQLAEAGSAGAPGFMEPEGIIIFHSASQQMYKKTFDGDAEGKEQYRGELKRTGAV